MRVIPILTANLSTAARFMATVRFSYNESNSSCRHCWDVHGLSCGPMLNSTSVSPVFLTKYFWEEKRWAVTKDFIHKGNFYKILYTDGSQKDHSTTYAVVSGTDTIFQENSNRLLSIFTVTGGSSCNFGSCPIPDFILYKGVFILNLKLNVCLKIGLKIGNTLRNTHTK